MKRHVLVASLIASVLISAGAFAPSVQALTVDEIQAQIKELLAKVADLTKQMNVLRGEAGVTAASNSGTAASMPLKHRICVILNRNLAAGAQGDDVRGLQEFLNTEGYFSATATGYFGPVTAQALARWQTSQGVQSAGSVGPLTRERIKIWCGGVGNEMRFSAAPSRGEAPLTVVFDTWLSGFRVQNIYFTIDFGDGSSERAADCYAPADACQSPGQNKHTYASNGTYTATLNKITDPCAGQLACKAAIHSEVVAKTQVYVGPIACTKEYMPVCGAKPIVCITTPCNPIPTTYGNRCMMNADGATFLYEGECRADSGKRPPVISGFSGPTSLTLNESGTWEIRASDPENGRLSYSITWGDEWTLGAAKPTTSSEASIVQSTTFTHSYARAGTYTVHVVVRDAEGKEARTSATVQVANTLVACTMEYAPVCGRPAGCANTCAPGMACPAVCKLYDPQTYGNRCQLNAAGAEFLYAGQCTSTSNAY